MSQNGLNRSVAQSTEKTISEISLRGFLSPGDIYCECEPPIDWDELEAERSVNIFPQRRRAPQVV